MANEKAAARPADRSVADKLADKLEARAAKAERLAEKAARGAEALERIGSHLRALDVWTRQAPPPRRPRFTREEIAATAMRIADAEGFDAVSMRRLATELGVATMSLYHYVRTKDELLALLVDEIMGEVVLPADEPLPADWRAALTIIACRSRDAMRRHPWMLDVTDHPALGPNSVRHFDQTLQAVASMPLPLADRLDVTAAVDEYVFGYCVTERINLGSSPDGPTDAEMVAYVNQLIRTGDYPQLRALVDEFGFDGAWTTVETHLRDPRRFERNLARLLDGIEHSFGLRSHTAGA
ncbi:MAG TPA: TetR/AcrR family transcriptional regulator C-terminal domain-containing protein [Acidimicrobiia bacterium]|nr:TetR/AcrR family transcriptional regulator C-terminal domain-containing protein [Acidimicrobiia bacterium]